MTTTDASKQNSPWLQAGRLVFVALYVVTLLAALRWGLSNVQQVNPDRRAVVVRLGALSRVQSAGLLLAWPNPIEQVISLPSAETVIERRVETLLRSRQAINADMSSADDDEAGPSSDAIAGSGYLLTGDAGIVQLDVRVFYKVVNPIEYVLQGEHVIPALDRIVTRSAVAVCAARDLDTILVARPELVSTESNVAEQRERLRGELLQRINRALAALVTSGTGVGIEVARVDVQSSLPASTISAFNTVLTASQQAEQGVADARTEAAWALQTATQSADRSLQVARAQGSEREAKAQTDTAAISQLSQSIKNKTDPGLALRLYRERMNEILSRAGSLTMVDPKDDAHLIIEGTTR
jgi:regulator of protease activity HflC (stomatin/prohibitin superfamily)